MSQAPDSSAELSDVRQSIRQREAEMMAIDERVNAIKLREESRRHAPSQRSAMTGSEVDSATVISGPSYFNPAPVAADVGFQTSHTPVSAARPGMGMGMGRSPYGEDMDQSVSSLATSRDSPRGGSGRNLVAARRASHLTSDDSSGHSPARQARGGSLSGGTTTEGTSSYGRTYGRSADTLVYDDGQKHDVAELRNGNGTVMTTGEKVVTVGKWLVGGAVLGGMAGFLVGQVVIGGTIAAMAAKAAVVVPKAGGVAPVVPTSVAAASGTTSATTAATVSGAKAVAGMSANTSAQAAAAAAIGAGEQSAATAFSATMTSSSGAALGTSVILPATEATTATASAMPTLVGVGAGLIGSAVAARHANVASERSHALDAPTP